MDNAMHVSRKLRFVLEETTQAQSNNSLLLGAIGLRLLVETVCSEISIKGRNLEKKIDALEVEKYIDIAERDILHIVRNFGNKGAHGAESMSAEQLASGLDVVVQLIDRQYVIPAKNKRIMEEASSVLQIINSD